MEKTCEKYLKAQGLTDAEINLIKEVEYKYKGSDNEIVQTLLRRYVIERIASGNKVKRCEICGIPVREYYEIDGEYACSEKCAEELYGDKEGFYEELKDAEDENSVVFFTAEPSYDSNDVFISEV